MGIEYGDLRRLQSLSVQVTPPANGTAGSFIMSLSGSADLFPAWGTSPVERDRQLREFYPTEPWLAGAVSALAARNAAMSWTLEGPPRTCDRIQEMLHISDMGDGWVHMMQRLSTDILTQDNGGFLEVIRDGSGAFMGLAHLDAAMCVRTGNLEYPVVYTDRDYVSHKLRWDQVIDFCDFPSPVETMNGMQMCAVSRVLRISQILRDVAMRKQEKLSGRFAGVMHIVSGISMQMIEDAFKKAEETSNNKGRARYQPPIVAGTLDPTATISKETIELASLPENWNEEEAMKWYIAVLALAFQCEYQDLAPLPGGGLGSSNQSQILHLKAKGRGPELWQKIIEHAFNFRLLPQNVTFRFDEKDYEAEKQEWEARKLRSDTRTQDVQSGVLTVQVARQMMEDDGDLRDEYLQMMQAEDVTQDETVEDEAPEQEGTLSQSTVEDQANAGPPPVRRGGSAQQQVKPGTVPLAPTKQLDASDYYGKQRDRMERQYEEEMAAVLEDVRQRVVKRLRSEVSNGG